jgi:3D (Asp-Asp-Asp) domain-containing protein
VPGPRISGEKTVIAFVSIGYSDLSGLRHLRFLLGFRRGYAVPYVEMLLSRSLHRKLLATAIGSVGFLLLYQATVMDSRSVAPLGPGRLGVGTRLSFVATAYCKGQVTASGVAVKAGVAAADPNVLPQGSVVELSGVPERHRGIYTVLDTGPKVQGKHVDVYMWSCNEALAFGRRPVTLTVLRLGWNPNSQKPTGPTGPIADARQR